MSWDISVTARREIIDHIRRTGCCPIHTKRGLDIVLKQSCAFCSYVYPLCVLPFNRPYVWSVCFTCGLRMWDWLNNMFSSVGHQPGTMNSAYDLVCFAAFLVKWLSSASVVAPLATGSLSYSHRSDNRWFSTRCAYELSHVQTQCCPITSSCWGESQILLCSKSSPPDLPP